MIFCYFILRILLMDKFDKILLFVSFIEYGMKNIIELMDYFFRFFFWLKIVCLKVIFFF